MCAVAILVILIIIIVAVVGAPTGRRYCDYLSGMWVGDPAFLRKAGLRDMQMFISPRKKGERQGYLVMVDEGGNFVANQAFDLSEKGGHGWCQNLKNHFRARDKYDVDVELAFDDADAPPIPSDLTLTVCVADGSLSLRDENKLYAFLWKDLAASSAAATAFEKGDPSPGSDELDDSTPDSAPLDAPPMSHAESSDSAPLDDHSSEESDADESD